MLRAGALYYALTTVLIIGVMTTSLIWYAHYTTLSIETVIMHRNAIRDVESGINLLLADPDNMEFGSQKVDLFNDDEHWTTLSRKRWGVYEIIRSEVESKYYTYSKSALIGNVPKAQGAYALYLQDNTQALSLCGNTIIRGDAYLPRNGVKAAYIEGSSYRGSQLVYGNIKKSTEKLPGLSPDLIAHLQQLISGVETYDDSIVAFHELEEYTLNQPFDKKTVILHGGASIDLSHVNLRGNICVYADQFINIGPSARLEDILVCSREVSVQKGFTGNLQIFGSNSVVLKEGVKLTYPSAAGIIQQDGAQRAALTLHKDALLEGVVLSYFENRGGIKRPFIDVMRGARVVGDVFSFGDIQHRGVIIGSLACSRITLETSASSYQNHLLNAVVNYHERHPEYVGAVTTDAFLKREIVKWV